MALEPEGLGSVRATVTVANDHVAVQLAADNADGHEALRQSLPQLRQWLQGDGTASATVTLSDGRGQSGARGNASGPTNGAASATEEEDGALSGAGPLVTSGGDGRLVDVRL